MRTVFKSMMVVSLAITGLGLAGCDSKKENAAEDQAQAVREAADTKADALDDKADTMAGPAKETTENKADAMRAAGDAKADRMENAADKMDKTPQ